MIYVGSPESSDHDQELDSVLVGPVPVGTNKFVFQVRRVLCTHVCVVVACLLLVAVRRLLCVCWGRTHPRAQCCCRPQLPPSPLSLSLSLSLSPPSYTGQADPPDHLQIPNLLGVTVVLLTCSYRDKEFIRIGYYVNVEYPGGAAAVAPGAAAGGGAAMDEGGVEAMEEDGGMETEVDQVLPANYDIADVTRSILAEKPRVTRFEVDWS